MKRAVHTALTLAAVLLVLARSGLLESSGAEAGAAAPDELVVREEPVQRAEEHVSAVEPRALVAMHERELPARQDHPHPVTAEHQRLYRDVDLLSAAESAIEEGRFQDARILLDMHHRELRGWSEVEEEGLWLLADCAEQPSAQRVARVRAFYDAHTDSTIRRRLRKRCLELGE